MNKYELLSTIERIQCEADEMAYNLIKAGQLAKIQSVCQFNIFWVSEISHMIATSPVIDFLSNNTGQFKRKLTIAEFMNADFLIRNFEVKTWDEFKQLFAKYKPELFNNLKQKTNGLRN